MSRLIVKNLPGYLDDAKLKAHFAKQAGSVITDVKILRRPDGTSRRFGFVGFRSEADAEDALTYFDKTYIDTSRISVTVAKSLQDEELKATQERRKAARRGLSDKRDGPAVRNGKSVAALDATEVASNDIKGKKKAISFEEFMEVMKPKSKRKAIGNGEKGDADSRLDPKIFQEEDLPVVKKAKREKTAKSGTDEPATTEQVSDQDANATEEVVASTANDESMTDMEYMYKMMKRKVGAEFEKEDAKQFEQSEDGDATEENAVDAVESENEEQVDENELHRQQRKRKAMEEKARKDEEDVDIIMTSGRLFVRNLPFSAQEDEIEGFFSRFGEVSQVSIGFYLANYDEQKYRDNLHGVVDIAADSILGDIASNNSHLSDLHKRLFAVLPNVADKIPSKQVHLSLDKTTKKSKGIAFVTFPDPSHALAAFRSTNGHTFQGRLVHVLPAVQQGPEPESKSLKDKRKQTLKADASKDFKWSTLYMSADAVAGSVADRLGIAKTDILNPLDEESGKSISPAVRLALAEASVINETRDYLKEEGINIDAFETSDAITSRRSDTVLLAKNIPYGTAADTIRSLFEKHGSVERVIMPSSGTIAVVEMQVPGEAKVAFKALSYKRLGNSVLYLEKAPVGILSEATQKTLAETSIEEPTESTLTSHAPESSSSKVESGATLFVKNLSFSTTDDRLQLAFSKFNDLLFVRIQKRESRKRDGSGSVSLSMGYAFVGFKTLKAAQVAQKAMDKTTLDGHVLSVAFSRRGHDEDTSAAAVDDKNEVAPSNKLIVKNLAFEATKKEVRELFAAYGKLKSVRVPRKGLASAGGAATGVRGFGFVEFVSRSEALYAYRALRHSHLLGRHLVLDWDVEGGPTSSSAGKAGLDGGEDAPALVRLRQKAAQNAAASKAAAAGMGAHRRDKLKLNEEDIREAARNEKRSQIDEDEDEDEDDG